MAKGQSYDPSKSLGPYNNSYCNYGCNARIDNTLPVLPYGETWKFG